MPARIALRRRGPGYTLGVMPGEDRPSVSGVLAVGLRDVAAEIAGAEPVARALGRLAPEHRERYLGMHTMGWVPIELMEAAFGAIAGELGRDVAGFHTEVARLSVARTMRTLWRVLLRFTGERALISRTPVLYARSYNRGRLVADVPEPGRGEIDLLDWPDVPEWPLRAVSVGVATVLEISGRPGAEVAWARTPSGAHFRATWPR